MYTILADFQQNISYEMKPMKVVDYVSKWTRAIHNLDDIKSNLTFNIQVYIFSANNLHYIVPKYFFTGKGNSINFHEISNKLEAASNHTVSNSPLCICDGSHSHRNSSYTINQSAGMVLCKFGHFDRIADTQFWNSVKWLQNETSQYYS